ncbi:LPXTG cell wall anchor domain-containing protein [Balamuthia mandrillaris]
MVRWVETLMRATTGNLVVKNAGRAWFIFGSEALSTGDLSPESPVSFAGTNTNDYVGSAVAAGDVNGDGLDDAVICASQADQHGFCAIIFGNNERSVPTSQRQVKNENGFLVTDSDVYTGFGSSVAVLDINHDGYADVCVGAPHSENNKGKVHCFFGKQSGFPRRFETSRLNGLNGITIVGEYASDLFGISLAGGDIDNDQRHDLVVGATGAFTGDVDYHGAIYVILGRGALRQNANYQVGNLVANQQAYYMEGYDGNTGFGRAVATGDFNADGVTDIAVTTEFGTYAYLILGGYAPYNPDAYFNRGLRIRGYGDLNKDPHWTSVAFGDVNGDGGADLILGAARGTTNEAKVQSGYIAILYGFCNEGTAFYKSSIMPTVELSQATTDVTIVRGNLNDEGLGTGLGLSVLSVPDGFGRSNILYGYEGENRASLVFANAITGETDPLECAALQVTTGGTTISSTITTSSATTGDYSTTTATSTTGGGSTTGGASSTTTTGGASSTSTTGVGSTTGFVPPTVNPLENGVISEQPVTQRGITYFQIDVPQGAATFQVLVTEGEGSDTMCALVRKADLPTEEDFDYRRCSNLIELDVENTGLSVREHTDDPCELVTYFVAVQGNPGDLFSIVVAWDTGCDGCGSVEDRCGDCPATGTCECEVGSYRNYEEDLLDQSLLTWETLRLRHSVRTTRQVIQEIQEAILEGKTTTPEFYDEHFELAKAFLAEIELFNSQAQLVANALNA